LFFEDLEVGGVHDSGEEAIRVVHFAVVDDEGVVIGDENEAETAGLPNPGHLVGHSAGDLGDIAEVHDGDDRWQVLVPLEFRLFELVAAVGLGDDQKLENAVFYVGDFGLFREGTKFWIVVRVPATYFDEENVISPLSRDSELSTETRKVRRRTM